MQPPIGLRKLDDYQLFRVDSLTLEISTLAHARAEGWRKSKDLFSLKVLLDQRLRQA